jgi:curved DNA-binding protein CbpA
MADITNPDYYARLGLPENATPEQIRAAFPPLVKQYHPDTSPTEYNLLREAFDVLKNPRSREEYDGRRKFGPEIERLNAQLDDANKREDWPAAEKAAKKLVTLQPRNAVLRKRLGYIYLNQDKTQLAVMEFEHAMTLDPEETSHLVDAAHAYKDLKKYIEAENLYRRAMSLDSSNQDAPRGLASMFWLNLERPNDAIAVLEKAMDQDGVLDFQDFFYLFDLLRLHLVGNQIDQMKKRLLQLKSIISSEEDKSLVTEALLSLIDFGVNRNFFMESGLLYDFLNKLKKNEHYANNAKLLMQTWGYYENKAEPELLRAMVLSLTMRYFETDSNDGEKQLLDLIPIIVDRFSCNSLHAKFCGSLNRMSSTYPAVYSTYAGIWDGLRNTSVNKNLAPCPHCGKDVSVDLYDYGQFKCPHCNSAFTYVFGSGYSAVGNSSSSSSTTASSSGGCLLSIAALTILAALFTLFGCAMF